LKSNPALNVKLVCNNTTSSKKLWAAKNSPFSTGGWGTKKNLQRREDGIKNRSFYITGILANSSERK